MKPKLAIVVSHPIQHFTPVYQLLARSQELDLTVLYYSDAGARAHFDKDFDATYKWDIDLMSGYKSVILRPEAPVVGSGFWNIDAPDLTAKLDREQPDAVLLYGYDSRLQWRAWQWARRRGKRLLYFSDSTLTGFRRRLWRRVAKALAVRRFFSAIDIFFAVGDRNLQYLKHYGATDDRIRRCPLSVDLGRFQASDPSTIARFRQEVRQDVSIGRHQFVVLFSGKLIRRKNPMDLLRAVRALRESGRDAVALFVGAGPLENTLKAAVGNSGGGEAARFSGFVNQRRIVQHFYAADAFAMTSGQDAHPLVVTEAAACGLPIIASENAGCVGPTDTAQDGRNALVYRTGDVKALANCIVDLMESPDLSRRMRSASLEIARTQDVTVAARVIANAVVETVTPAGPGRSA